MQSDAAAETCIGIYTKKHSYSVLYLYVIIYCFSQNIMILF